MTDRFEQRAIPNQLVYLFIMRPVPYCDTRLVEGVEPRFRDGQVTRVKWKLMMTYSSD